MIDLNDQNFKEEVLESNKPVLVDMYTNWCPPCKVIAPMVEKIAEDYQEKIKVGKLNVDEARGTAMTYGIEAIPTLMIFKQGQVKDRIVGLVPYEVLIKKIEDSF
ncbi:thioredoxin [Candidatus Parcubacteria bacterium]|nr:thioredoxin [Candidatus Parcubacteria bacterium]